MSKKQLTTHPPVIMLVAKAFQRPDIPRARQEATTLVEAGYPVYVLAWDRYAEYPAVQNVDGAAVRSLVPVNLTKFSRFGLAIGGLLFAIQLFPATLRLIIRLGRRPIIHSHDINTLMVGVFFRVLGLCSALVYDCREFTYGLYYEWFNLLVACFMRSIEERCLRYADAVITVSDPIAHYLRRFNPRTEIVYNCPRFSDVPKISKKEARRTLNLPEDGFIVSSVGTLRYDCRLDLLLHVADLTKQHNITYLVVGDGPAAAEFRHDVTRMSDARLILLPRVSRNVALTSILASDLTWAIYQNRPESFNPRMTLPWKFFESLACGVPLIVDAGTFRAELVKELKCGIVVENDDPAEISSSILSLVNTHLHHDMSASAKHVSTSRSLGWEAMSVRLVAVYSRLG